jgi:glycerophosphoryl diester phosphodiesterase
MQQGVKTLAIAAVFALLPMVTMSVAADRFAHDDGHPSQGPHVQLGPRPFYLVDKMDPSRLKEELQKCADRPFFYQTDFSIGHRGGGTLQFPEHTKESHEAGARMGAGILECDVTFTQDLELVCRHSQCDLHITTNIVDTPLAAKCSVPPQVDQTGVLQNGPAITCCTSDITLAEFKTLCGKMDGSNPNATTIEGFLAGTPSYRTDLYSTCGTLLSHKESIKLIAGLGAKFTPELKAPSVEMPFHGFTQNDYRQKMIDEYKQAGVHPKNVFAQSFNLDDIRYWIEHEPQFGKQAVYLNDHFGPTCTPPQPCNQDPNQSNAWDPPIEQLVADGVQIIAPPMWVLLTVKDGNIVPSEYAKAARKAGLDIITWTTERSGRLFEDVLQGGDNYHYQSTLAAIHNDGDILVTLDVLAKQVGILGIFSDWAATPTFYANCMDLK